MARDAAGSPCAGHRCRSVVTRFQVRGQDRAGAAGRGADDRVSPPRPAAPGQTPDQPLNRGRAGALPREARPPQRRRRDQLGPCHQKATLTVTREAAGLPLPGASIYSKVKEKCQGQRMGVQEGPLPSFQLPRPHWAPVASGGEGRGGTGLDPRAIESLFLWSSPAPHCLGLRDPSEKG